MPRHTQAHMPIRNPKHPHSHTSEHPHICKLHIAYLYARMHMPKLPVPQKPKYPYEHMYSHTTHDEHNRQAPGIVIAPTKNGK